MRTRPFSFLTSPRTPSCPGPRRAFPRLLRYAGVVSVLQCLISPAFSQMPAGWKTTQDMNKACQIAFPPAWAVTPDGQATTPDGGRGVLVVSTELEYIVDQQFKTLRCKFQLFVPKGYSEAEVMKMVATLGSTH